MTFLRSIRGAALAASCGAALAAALPAQGTTANPDRREAFVVECGLLVTGPAALPDAEPSDEDVRSYENAAFVVRGGRIEQILTEGTARPLGLRRVDLSDKVVIPGLVAADTNLAGASDADYQVTPDFVALDGFDFLQDRKRQLGGGVTTVYLSPGRNRLIPGQGSVVKLHGDDIVERVLDDRACLRVTLDARSTAAPFVFEPTLAPTSDDPLVPARRQVPSARVSQLWALRQVFDEAARTPAEDGLVGPGKREDRYDPEPLRQVLAGNLPLRVAAREAADIRRALELAKGLGVDLVVEDPWELGPVAGDFEAAGATAVVRIPFRFGAPNAGGEDLTRLDDPRPSLDNLAVAARTGIKVALVPASDADLDDLLLAAGFAVRAGMTPADAFAAITTRAAEALGVGDRVGRLEPGMDADFVVLSGEPFAVGTLVEQTWVDGERAYEREAASDALVVRADTVMTARGPSITGGGAVVAKGGRIKSVGPGLAAPFGAQEIVLPPGSVITPGFVNAHTSAGLSGEGTGIPQGNAATPVHEVVRPDDPVLRAVAEAGVTTVLVSGRDGSGTVGARVAAVKTAGEDAAGMVVREIAAIRMSHDVVGGDDAIKPLAAALDKGKAYLDAWNKYEKELAEYEKAKKEGKKLKKKPVQEPETPDEGEPPAAADPVSGIWEFSASFEGRPIEIGARADVRLADGGKVTGSLELKLIIQGREITRPAELTDNCTYNNGTLSLEFSGGPGGTAKLEGKVTDDKFTGTLEFGPLGSASVQGERVEKASADKPVVKAASSKKADDGAPKKPKVDENLEPIRAVYEGKATAVVDAKRAPAIEDVVALFAERKLPLVLTGVDDAIDTPRILGDTPPPVLLGPQLVRYEKGELVNAPAVLADRDVALALGTGDTLGARYLPQQVAHAIRYGLDPEAALRALTSDVAAAFRIGDRVGSLERGKDADFVAWSGNPFEPTSRVLLVVVDGRVVVDNRERSGQ